MIDSGDSFAHRQGRIGEKGYRFRFIIRNGLCCKGAYTILLREFEKGI
jgi:hypothetical protein